MPSSNAAKLKGERLQISNYRIMVIGGANLDIKAKADGVSEMGTSNPGAVHMAAGGVARNIAHNLGLLGVDVGLITVFGDDAAAKMIRDATSTRVDLSLSLTVRDSSGCYVALLDSGGELLQAVNAMGIMDNLSAEHMERVFDQLETADLIICDCNLRESVLQFLTEHFGDKLIVEPVSVPKCEKLKSVLKTHKIFLATPNRDQFSAMGGSLGQLKAPSGLTNCLIHMGSAGACLITVGNSQHIPPFKTGVIADVTGGGDASVAGLAFGLSKGYDLPKCASFGQAAAALTLASHASHAEALLADTLEEMVKHGQ